MSALAVTTTSLPNGTVGTPYSFNLVATGGTPSSSGTFNYVWANLGTTLPAGLNLSSSGVISGTPTGLIPTNTTSVTTNSNAIVTDGILFQVNDGTTTARSRRLSLTITQTATTTSSSWWPWVLGAGVFIIFILVVIFLVWYNSTPVVPLVDVPVVEQVPTQTTYVPETTYVAQAPATYVTQAPATYVTQPTYAAPAPVQNGYIAQSAYGPLTQSGVYR